MSGQPGFGSRTCSLERLTGETAPRRRRVHQGGARVGSQDRRRLGAWASGWGEYSWLLGSLPGALRADRGPAVRRQDLGYRAGEVLMGVQHRLMTAAGGRSVAARA